jgi:twitching motility two-component system response regulator PilH
MRMKFDARNAREIGGKKMPRLLIVDDDESVRKLLRFNLKDAYEVTDTGSPEEALALALQEKPDAILLDLSMPRYSGFEICQTFSSLSFTQLIPILIVSGESATRYKDFCESLGAKGYFQKPVDFDALRMRLTDVLGARRADRRAEPRVRLKVMLTLRGADAAGRSCEIHAVTEDVSVSGFLCGCTAQLKIGTTLEVSTNLEGREQKVGRADVTRVAWKDTPGQQYGFHFHDVPMDWVLR